METKNI